MESDDIQLRLPLAVHTSLTIEQIEGELEIMYRGKKTMKYILYKFDNDASMIQFNKDFARKVDSPKNKIKVTLKCFTCSHSIILKYTFRNIDDVTEEVEITTDDETILQHLGWDMKSKYGFVSDKLTLQKSIFKQVSPRVFEKFPHLRSEYNRSGITHYRFNRRMNDRISSRKEVYSIFSFNMNGKLVCFDAEGKAMPTLIVFDGHPTVRREDFYILYAYTDDYIILNGIRYNNTKDVIKYVEAYYDWLSILFTERSKLVRVRDVRALRILLQYRDHELVRKWFQANDTLFARNALSLRFVTNLLFELDGPEDLQKIYIRNTIESLFRTFGMNHSATEFAIRPFTDQATQAFHEASDKL